jgi:hypothetical protein
MSDKSLIVTAPCPELYNAWMSAPNGMRLMRFYFSEKANEAFRHGLNTMARFYSRLMRERDSQS